MECIPAPTTGHHLRQLVYTNVSSRGPQVAGNVALILFDIALLMALIAGKYADLSWAFDLSEGQRMCVGSQQQGTQTPLRSK